jgi:hypothetical protein
MKVTVAGAHCAAMFAFAAASSASEFKELDATDLRQAVSGKTLRLETPVGSIPISFRADGTMVGRTSDMVNWLGRNYDQGTWWIARDQLCQRWKLWLESKPYCFTLRRSGTQVQWIRNDGLKGVLTVVSN